MSTPIQERTPGGVVVLPPSVEPEDAVNASMTRWVWFCGYRIDNRGPISLMRHFGAGPRHRYNEFQPGNFYPLKNIEWLEKDLEAIAEQNRAGIRNARVPDLKYVKYAYDQAEELISSFPERGMCVFQPGLWAENPGWVDNLDLVQVITHAIQPTPFKVHEMAAEFGEKAKARIEKADLTYEEKQLAHKIRLEMLAGAGRAMAEFQRAHTLLIQDMGNALINKPGKAKPDVMDEWRCEQMGIPVPQSVQERAAPQQNTNTQPIEEAISLLTKLVAQNETKQRRKQVEPETETKEAA